VLVGREVGQHRSIDAMYIDAHRFLQQVTYWLHKNGARTGGAHSGIENSELVSNPCRYLTRAGRVSFDVR
jgi:hypothetical protein